MVYWCFWSLMWCWRRLLRVPWTVRWSNQSILKKINSEWFTGRTDTKAKAPILWSPDVKSWFIRKDPDAGRDWGQEDKGTTEDEMAGWHHRLDRHEFGWSPGAGDGQGGLPCCNSWGRKELDMTEQQHRLIIRINIYNTLNQALGYSKYYIHISQI